MAETRGMKALSAALEAAHHLNDAMRALQEMQADMDDRALYTEMRDAERDVDAIRDIVLGTRRLLQVQLGLIDRETGAPLTLLRAPKSVLPFGEGE